jgi:hypothetical protein
VAAEVGMAVTFDRTGVPQVRQNRLFSGITDEQPAHFAIQTSMAQPQTLLNFTNLYAQCRNTCEMMEFQAVGAASLYEKFLR